MEIKNLIAQNLTAKKISFTFVFVLAPALFFYLISVSWMEYSGFALEEILKEPPMVTNTSSLTGFVSNIGNFIWVASFSICFFTIYSHRQILSYEHKELLFLTGFLSLLLCIDDFFMIHDLYVDQHLCYLVYAISAFALLGRHFKLIIKIEGLVFFIACFFLAWSVFTDITQDFYPISTRVVQIFEEGFKFIGISAWLYYCIKISLFTQQEE
jgi:hypothetical protein